MGTMSIAGQTVEVNDEGYLLDASQWNEDIAREIAKEAGIELTDTHLKLIKFLRENHESGKELTIRKVGKSGIVDIKGFYQLFPKKPLKLASKISGIPKPTSCI